MEKYRNLEKLYFMKKDIKEELKSRLENPCALKTNLFINPVLKGRRELNSEFELFYLPIQDILLLEEEIFSNSKEIINLIYKLPEDAKNWCIRNIMINEIIKSNGIEGVYSTKKDIHNSINSRKPDRFTGVINKYKQIIENNIEKIESIQDIRKIYDDIFREDILKDSENQLDGKYFRKESVSISDGFNTIHSGDSSENEIIKHLKSLVDFMNYKKVNSLVKAAITHYYIEYIHPFYDGNGRFGRLLFSMYLARKLDILTGLSISYSIFSEKDRYYKLFRETSVPRNCGEMTFFILEIFKIIKKGQKSIIEMLNEKLLKLDYIASYIENLNLTKLERKTLSLYLEHGLFQEGIPLEDREMLKILNIGRTKLKTVLSTLVEKGFIVKVKSSPSIHRALVEECF